MSLNLIDKLNLNGYPDHSEEWAEAIRTETVKTIEAMTPAVLVLPSGKKVTVIRPNPFQLMESGLLPDVVAYKMFAFLKKLGEVRSEADATGKDSGQAAATHILSHWNQFFDEVANPLVCAVCVSPRFVTDTTDIDGPGVVHIRHMSGDDRLYLFNWLNGVDVEELSSFRDEPTEQANADLGAVRDDGVVGNRAVGEVGHPAEHDRRVRVRPSHLDDRSGAERTAQGGRQGADDAEEAPAGVQDRSSVHVRGSDRVQAPEARRGDQGRPADRGRRRGPRGGRPANAATR